MSTLLQDTSFGLTYLVCVWCWWTERKAVGRHLRALRPPPLAVERRMTLTYLRKVFKLGRLLWRWCPNFDEGTGIENWPDSPLSFMIKGVKGGSSSENSRCDDCGDSCRAWMAFLSFGKRDWCGACVKKWREDVDLNEEDLTERFSPPTLLTAEQQVYLGPPEDEERHERYLNPLQVKAKMNPEVGDARWRLQKERVGDAVDLVRVHRGWLPRTACLRSKDSVSVDRPAGPTGRAPGRTPAAVVLHSRLPHLRGPALSPSMPSGGGGGLAGSHQP